MAQMAKATLVVAFAVISNPVSSPFQSRFKQDEPTFVQATVRSG